MPPRPPPPKKPNTILKVVKAVYTYTPTRPDEVAFNEGDQLYILSEPESGWYMARVGNQDTGKSGLIPSNYVEENTETVENPMHEAAKRGNEAFLMDCIGNRISVNGLDYAGATPLHWAAGGGYIGCVRILLRQSNVLINVQNKLGDTPLHQAAWKGQAECVEALLDAGCNSTLVNNEGKAAFKLAKGAGTQALLRDLKKEQSQCDFSEYINDEAAEDSD